MVNSTIETDREQHRRREVELAAPHGERPVDDLHAGGDGDQHRADREHRNADRAETAGEHVVCPHAPTEEADRRAGEDHELVAEQRLAAEHRQHFADDAEAGQDEDVHLRMPEDPEQVLPQQRIGAGVDVEELRTEVALEHQQEQRHGDDRDGEHQQELHDQDHPREDRHLHQAHARCAHVEDRDDQVERTGQRGDAGDLQSRATRSRHRGSARTGRWRSAGT